MPLAGVSPSLSLLAHAGLVTAVCRALTRCRVHVLIRPRPGDFRYSAHELQASRRQAVLGTAVGDAEAQCGQPICLAALWVILPQVACTEAGRQCWGVHIGLGNCPCSRTVRHPYPLPAGDAVRRAARRVVRRARRRAGRADASWRARRHSAAPLCGSLRRAG